MPMTPYQAQMATHFGPQTDLSRMKLVAQLLRAQNPTVMNQGMPTAPTPPPIQNTAPAMSAPRPTPPVTAQAPGGPPQGPPDPQQGPPQSQNQLATGGAGTDVSPYGMLDDKSAMALMSLGDKDRQLKLAERLRDQDSVKGNTVRNQFVADVPGAAIQAYQRFRGAKDAKRLGNEQTAGRMQILDLLRGKKRDSAAEAQGSTPTAEGDGY
jgi:hypothetical protein